MSVTKVFTVPDAGEGRIVQHYGDSVTQAAIINAVGAPEFYRAVGYLSAWNLSFPEVRIYYNAKEREITASYYTSMGVLAYCIGAVLNPVTNTFGFHS